MTFQRISIIGFGNIGKFLCSQLLTSKDQKYSINLMDPDESVKGALLDFQHANQLNANHQLNLNNKEELAKADIIFHSAGASVPKGQSRLVSCFESIAISEAIFSGLQFEGQPFIIVVANPVEIICTVCQKLTGLPKQNIIGTGTFLDSIRLNHYISKLKPELKNIKSVILGEHGASAFLSKKLSSIENQPFDERLNQEEINFCMKQMRSAAETIKASQKATIYGVGFCALKIMEFLYNDEENIAPVSTYLDAELKKELNCKEIYLSRYARINKEGAHPISYELPDEEVRAFMASAKLLEEALPKKYG